MKLKEKDFQNYTEIKKLEREIEDMRLSQTEKVRELEQLKKETFITELKGKCLKIKPLSGNLYICVKRVTVNNDEIYIEGPAIAVTYNAIGETVYDINENGSIPIGTLTDIDEISWEEFSTEMTRAFNIIKNFAEKNSW